ncbi:MAG: permease [Candidatus Marinimicrobia bacterium]|nr:permease [Candidatus Neomarinimicrobiota bacterium]
MQNTTIIINGLVLILLGISFFKDKTKTLRSLKIAGKSLLELIPTMLSVILLIGIIYGLFSDKIGLLFGNENGTIGFILIAVAGSFMHMPSLLAFPLAGSFLMEGASISSVAAFITTLTMIGIVTLPLEIQTLGKKFAIYRNVFSFIIAILIAILMGVIL